MPKKTFLMLIALVLIVIALAIAATFYWSRNHISNSNISNNNPASSVVSHQFIGQIQKIEGNTITASGRFILDKSSQPSDAKSHDVQIMVSSDTKFTDTLLHTPITKPGQAWNLATMQKENVVTDLNKLTATSIQIHGLDITVSADNNILNSSNFNAAAINYTEDVSQ